MIDYTLDASELYQMAKDIINSGCTQVTLTLLEADASDPEDPIPPCVSFKASTPREPDAYVDFGELDCVPGTYSMQ